MNMRYKEERFKREGVEVLWVRIGLPPCEGLESVGDFYREMGECAYRFACERLLPYAEKCFDEDTDERKRFHFAPICYHLDARVRYEDERLLSVFLEVSLFRKDRKKETRSFSDAQVWLRNSELLLSPREALRVYWGREIGEKCYKPKGKILLTERGAMEEREGKWQLLVPPS